MVNVSTFCVAIVLFVFVHVCSISAGDIVQHATETGSGVANVSLFTIGSGSSSTTVAASLLTVFEKSVPIGHFGPAHLTIGQSVSNSTTPLMMMTSENRWKTKRSNQVDDTDVIIVPEMDADDGDNVDVEDDNDEDEDDYDAGGGAGSPSDDDGHSGGRPMRAKQHNNHARHQKTVGNSRHNNHSSEPVDQQLDTDNVDYVMHSPRTVNTKYGSLQGIVVTFVRYSEQKQHQQQYNKETSTSTTPITPQTTPLPPSSNLTLLPVEAFLGVPYASPPSGNLRFMPPVAPVHWRGVRQANHLAPVCPQSLPQWANITDSDTLNRNISQRLFDRIQRQLPFLRNQSEDCLHLNIYVPFHHYYQHRKFQRNQQQQQQQQGRKSNHKTIGELLILLELLKKRLFGF